MVVLIQVAILSPLQLIKIRHQKINCTTRATNGRSYSIRPVKSPQAIRINKCSRVVPHVSIKIHIPSLKPNRVFLQEPPDRRVVIPGPIIIKPVLPIRKTRWQLHRIRHFLPSYVSATHFTHPRARRPPLFFDITCKFGLICFVLAASPANATRSIETHSINLPDRRFHGELRVVFHSELHPACGRTARARVLDRALPLAQRRAYGTHPDGVLPGVRQRGSPEALRLLLVRSQKAILRHNGKIQLPRKGRARNIHAAPPGAGACKTSRDKDIEPRPTILLRSILNFHFHIA